MNRYLCIHGHFYQPPRENPWLEAVELQDAAYPYHDWNERITRECYAPNGASRILDRENKIIDIVNNYAKMSFNFGPTLLSWLERNHSSTYEAIMRADKESQKNFSGHGSAIAQVYNHIIMPLANKNDKRTQIQWGIKDFMHRFQRPPEGMWLAETAVDLETLDIMAEYGIKFTILSPYQAQKRRKIDGKEWEDVGGGKIDPKMPYLCRLPSGKTISIFFYDGPISQDIAFGGLLGNGENFANRLIGTFSSEPTSPQLVHIATDGETYGHHHNYGEMALSYGYHYISSNKHAQITVYAEYLEKFPPTYEVQIIEYSSWSCFHGVERWKNNCGCKIGTDPSWNQAWRAPLRESMDWLRDTSIKIYEEQISAFVHDPWQVRNDYIDIILDRRPENTDAFLAHHTSKALSDSEKVKMLKLLEMQRHAMLMYTSCGWFFDEISGIETMQVINYAARVIQLAKETSDIELEPGYLKILKKAKSNIAEYENGARLYEMFIRPTMLDLKRVGAHYAVSSLFIDYKTSAEIYCYKACSNTHERMEAGRQQLVTGSVRLTSDITQEHDEVSYAVLHLGDHIVFGGVCDILKDDVFAKMQRELKESFQKSAVSEIISLLNNYFGSHDYSLWHLFRDEQRRVLNQILGSTLREIETSFRQINENHYPIMLAMKEIGMPLPSVFASTFEFIFNTDIRNELAAEPIDMKRLQDLIKGVKQWALKIDKTTLGFVTSAKIKSLMEEFNEHPEKIALIKTIGSIFKIMKPLSLPLRLWEAQNIYFSMKKELYDMMEAKAKQMDKVAKKWIESFEALGNYLWVRSK